MAKMKLRISGCVSDSDSRRGLEGLRVEAWDKDLIVRNAIGIADTDEHGDFRLEFGESDFQVMFGERRPDLFFKVFRDDQLIHSTEGSVVWNLAVRPALVDIEVDPPGQQELRPSLTVASLEELMAHETDNQQSTSQVLRVKVREAGLSAVRDAAHK